MKNTILWVLSFILIVVGVRVFNTYEPYLGIGIIIGALIIIYKQILKQIKQ